MRCIDLRLGFFQLIHVTLWSLWFGRWLVTYDPQARRVRVWRP